MMPEKHCIRNYQNIMSKPQLFCFTYAGGTASFFDDIEQDFTGIDLVKFEYSGHGTRHKEPFYKDFDDLADDMLEQFNDMYSGGCYSLFGYSMGSISLVEVLKRLLNKENYQKPSHVFLAAHEPHTKAELVGFSSGELDEWVKQRTIKFGAVPEVLLNNATFWRMYLPIYRADYSLIGNYRFEDLNLKTQIPATVFYSETDTPRNDIMMWRDYFVGKCTFHCYEGTHFFIQNHHQEMAEVIKSELELTDDI